MLSIVIAKLLGRTLKTKLSDISQQKGIAMQPVH